MRKACRNIILSIETTSKVGRLSLFDGATEIDFWAGNNKASKAEDVLEEISNLLKKNNIEKKYISSIIVSKSSGSSTGIKIGLAIAKGLKTAINCKIIEV